ncbi:MAG: hypothetical protein KBS95_03350 [Alistipes sp.]|nr:hypothetical protein [Candidatus Alistipes equi]
MIALVGVICGGPIPFHPLALSSESPAQDTVKAQTKRPAKKNPKYVDLKSIQGRQTEIFGRKVLIATVDFAAHHNGTVITCDSAVRLSESRLECYGHVLLKKGTTYIYGDKATYDGEENLAKVFSKIVKVVDGEAILYTYNFEYNTKTNIGWFHDGGVATKGNLKIETKDGFYNTETKELRCIGDVELRDERYDMKSDSAWYYTERNLTYFFSNTHIWDKEKSNYLSADRGVYDSNSEIYTITKNGYILTKDEEGWSDSIDYDSRRGYVLFRNDFQLDNQKDKVMAFGDWGEYWEDPGNAFLTRNPSILSYDTEQSDSVFIRADSMYLFTKSLISKADSTATSSVEEKSKGQQEALSTPSRPSLPSKNGALGAKEAVKNGKQPSATDASKEAMRQKAQNLTDNVKENLGVDKNMKSATTSTQDSTLVKKDSIAKDSLSSPLDTMSKKERKIYLDSLKRMKKAEIKKIKADSLQAKLERIAQKRQAKRTAYFKKLEYYDSIAKAKEKRRYELKVRKRVLRAERRGKKILPLSMEKVMAADSILSTVALQSDSIALHLLDSIIPLYFQDVYKLLYQDSIAGDTSYKHVLALGRIKLFRRDFQAVCDSLSGTSIDSILHLHKNPVLWNGSNQITSDIMHVITIHQQIRRADFEGSPMTVAEIDTAHYNQVAGKEMKAFFKDNSIYRNDVNGNVQTIYYFQEDGEDEVSMMAYIESGDMTSYIKDKQVTGITYRENPTYTFYPINKIPETQPTKLKGFKWEALRRPTLDSVFTRRLRPSVREEKRVITRPLFPIEQALERNKQRFISRDRWEDRTDTLSLETIEWLSSLSTLY